MTGERSFKYLPHASAAVIAVVSGLVYHFEGDKLHAYFDPPHVASICEGHTHGVKITDTATPTECANFRADDIKEAWQGVHRLIRRPMTEGQEEAFTDFIFNEGEGTFSRSSILRDFNAGRTKAACQDLLKYTYAGGVPLPGLEKRREAEFTLCMKGT